MAVEDPVVPPVDPAASPAAIAGIRRAISWGTGCERPHPGMRSRLSAPSSSRCGGTGFPVPPRCRTGLPADGREARFTQPGATDPHQGGRGGHKVLGDLTLQASRGTRFHRGGRAGHRSKSSPRANSYRFRGERYKIARRTVAIRTVHKRAVLKRAVLPRQRKATE
jgi:hypothetical protein